MNQDFACCGNCIYMRTDESVVDVKTAEHTTCHRFPPMVNGIDEETSVTNFPMVSKFEWCGEWNGMDE